MSLPPRESHSCPRPLSSHPDSRARSPPKPCPPRGTMRALHSASRTRLRFELLEDRSLPTTATYLANGTLAIMGTDASDVIRVSQANGQYSVSGIAQTFSNVSTVVVDGGAGDDQIVIDPSVTATTWLYAGDGNNYIQGGSGTNHIYGGRGNDTLVAGSANDIVYGG